jgi:TorA maturation chaperone TorD
MSTTAVDEQLLADRLDAFAAAYTAMSRFLLAPIDAQLFTLLTQPGLLDAWPLTSDPDTRRGLNLLAASIREGETEPALHRDYDRLFVGPNPLLAPPYESVHLTVEQLMFDTPTFEVRAAYRAFGVQAPRLNREPDDHLGLEFSFLALLCCQAHDALANGDEAAVEMSLQAQRLFLGDHLLRWAGKCLTAVESHADTTFYRGVGAVGLGVTNRAAFWLQ